MGIPVVIRTAGGMPVTVATHGYGVPMTVATNGFGIAVTQAANGLPVSGITFGPDVTAPVITSSNTVSNAENSVLAHTLTANEPVTWAIVAGGADNARFEISGSTLRWLSNGTKDFEAPNDANTDNAYIVTVRATDLASNPSTIQTITVTVTDVTGAAAAAPVLLLTSGTGDNMPDFTLTGDLLLNDTVRFQYSTSAVFSGASEITNTIDSTEDAANVLNFSTGALANGTWYFRARIERPSAEGAGISGWSNTETIAISVAGGSAESTQFLARISGTNATRDARYVTLIDALVADGLWPKISALWMFATDTRGNAVINLKNSSFTCVEYGTVNFTAGRGYLGNGTNFWIDSRFNPSTDGGSIFTLNSASCGGYGLRHGITTAMGPATLLAAGWLTNTGIQPQNNGFHIFAVNAGQITPTDSSSSQGFYVASRTASNATALYRNGGTPIGGVDTTTPTSLEIVTIAIGAFKNGPGLTDAIGWTVNELACAFFGGGLTQAEVGTLNTRIAAYMTAYGLP